MPSFIGAEPATIGAGWITWPHVSELVGIEHVGIGADFIQQVHDLGAVLEIDGWGSRLGEGAAAIRGHVVTRRLTRAYRRAAQTRLVRTGHGAHLSRQYFRSSSGCWHEPGLSRLMARVWLPFQR